MIVNKEIARKVFASLTLDRWYKPYREVDLPGLAICTVFNDGNYVAQIYGKTANDAIRVFHALSIDEMRAMGEIDADNFA